MLECGAEYICAEVKSVSLTEDGDFAVRTPSGTKRYSAVIVATAAHPIPAQAPPATATALRGPSGLR